MRKKVIALTISTELTNEELERVDNVEIVVRRVSAGDDGVVRVSIPARNVRVLDSD